MLERHLSPTARERIEEMSDWAGCLSLPMVVAAIVCLYADFGNAILLFVVLWIAFGFAVAGAHLSTGDGRIVGRLTILLLSVGAFLIIAILLPDMQQARE
jgi:hypothetical protein